MAAFRDAIREKRAYEAQDIGPHPLPEPYLQTGLARSLAALGRHQEALEHLSRSQEAGESPLTLAEIAMQHAILEECEDTEEPARDALTQQAVYERNTMIHSHALAHHALAICWNLRDNSRAALDNIERAIEITRVFRAPDDLEELRDSIMSGGLDTGWKAGLDPFARDALRRADSHMLEGRHALALEAYREAIAFHRKPSQELQRGAARALVLLGRKQEAVGHFTAAIDIRGSSSLHLERAQALRDTGLCGAAIQDAKSAQELEAETLPGVRNTRIEAMMLAAMCWREMDEPATALSEVQEAILLAREQGYPTGETDAMMELRDILEPEAEAQREAPTPAPAVPPTPTRIPYVSVLTLDFLDEHERMMTHYHAGLYPETILSGQTALEELGYALRKASPELIPPDEVRILQETHTTMGHALAQTGEPDRAVSAYEKTIELEDEPGARLALAALLIEKKRNDPAIQHVLRARSLPDASIAFAGAPEVQRSSRAEACRMLTSLLRSKWLYRESLEYANLAVTSAARSGLYTEDEIADLRTERNLAASILQVALDRADDRETRNEALREQLRQEQQEEEENED